MSGDWATKTGENCEEIVVPSGCTSAKNSPSLFKLKFVCNCPPGPELVDELADLATAQITTRDIDRGDFRHYLLKEISEAPGSFRKTLRGRIRERDVAKYLDERVVGTVNDPGTEGGTDSWPAV